MQVFFDFIPDVINKCSRFFKTLLKKGLKFDLSEESNPLLLNLSFVLFLAEVDLISEEQSCKGDMLVVCGTSRVQMIFILPAKVVTLYVWALIIEIVVICFKTFFLEGGICLAMFLALDDQF